MKDLGDEMDDAILEDLLLYDYSNNPEFMGRWTRRILFALLVLLRMIMVIYHQFATPTFSCSKSLIALPLKSFSPY